jgi:hypothetical protein
VTPIRKPVANCEIGSDLTRYDQSLAELWQINAWYTTYWGVQTFALTNWMLLLDFSFEEK